MYTTGYTCKIIQNLIWYVLQTSGPAVSLDLFGGMSPFSCWNQTAPEDPRFS